MKICIVHLSDLHISDKNDILLKRVTNLSDSIIGSSSEISEILLLVSGDIALSGLTDQYSLAKEFFQKILLAANKANKSLSIFFVPGNHDCDFSKRNPIRENLVDTVSTDPSKFCPEFIQACCDPQQNYYNFINNFNSYTIDEPIEYILNSQVVEYNGFNIRIDMFNSSWISNLSEKPGSLYMPTDLFFENLEIHKEDLSIALMHHTLNWLNPDNYRGFRNFLELNYHFVFTGHEHESSMSLRTRIADKISTDVFEGDVLQDHTSKDTSGFNFMMVDLGKVSYKLYNIEWIAGHYTSKEITKGWEPIKSTTYRSAEQFNISVDFEKQLNDPGASFKHPRKKEIEFDDIYVPPDLLILSKTSKISESLIYERKNAKEIIKEINGESYSLILGANSSGKTMVCHYFFKLLHKKNFIPIYVDGSTIHSKSIDAFIRLVEKKYQEQYLSADLDIFRQRKNENKAIILDNLHCAHLNSNAKRILLSLICETFKTVLCTANLTFAIEDLAIAEGVEAPVIPNLKLYQLSPFGHVLRSKLITKWSILGQEDKIEKGELIRQHDHFQKITNTVLGKNLIPSYPFFLIIILQRCEDDIPHDIQSSAYGYYYEYLILRALKDVKKRNEEIDAIYNYLTELANFLFEQKIRTLTQDKFISFHSWYCAEYRITPSFSDTINSLLESQILIERYDGYGFRYPYIYYFFVANYLANNMTNKDIRERVSKMCMRLYQQEFTNIIMFLTHLSKDPFILDRVLYSAKSIFGDESPQYFDEPIIEINNLLDSIPDIVLGSLNVEEERKKKLELEDKANPPNIEASESLPECDYDLESEIKDPESIEHFIMSFLTIQILGQILKNYYGSLKGEIKLQLGEEAYLIALRAINRFYKKLILSKGNLINTITQRLIDLGVQNKRSATRLSQEILFTLCRFTPKIFFEQISKSLAYNNLIETFNDIKLKNNSIAFEMIDIAVRMDCQKNFPIKESVDLLKRIKNDTLPNLMLKDLVLNHLYLFPRKRAEVQSICDKLGISRKITKSMTLK